eukprot:1139057-Pelagomonas_calceolata.AAC.7
MACTSSRRALVKAAGARSRSPETESKLCANTRTDSSARLHPCAFQVKQSEQAAAWACHHASSETS